MLKVVTGIIGAVLGAFWLAFVGAGAMAWWDHRPPHTPSVDIPINLVLFHPHFRWTAPESLAAQRDDAKAALLQERAAVVVLRAAIDRQNAAVRDASARSEAAIAEAETAVRRSDARAAETARRLAAIRAAGTSGTACERVEAVDRAFVGTLR